MEDKLLRHLRYKARLKESQLGTDAFEGQVAFAYDAVRGWRVRVVPGREIAITISEDRVNIHVSFCGGEEIAVRDFILPLLESETYREKQEEDERCRCKDFQQELPLGKAV